MPKRNLLAAYNDILECQWVRRDGRRWWKEAAGAGNETTVTVGKESVAFDSDCGNGIQSFYKSRLL